MREHAAGNRRIAVDKIMVHGLRALEALGLEVMEGEEVTERTRAIKGPEKSAPCVARTMHAKPPSPRWKPLRAARFRRAHIRR